MGIKDGEISCKNYLRLKIYNLKVIKGNISQLQLSDELNKN